jgi:hypothetical protein
MIQTGKTWRTREKLFLVPLCPPHLSHGLAHDRSRASVVRGQTSVGMCVASNLNTIRQFVTAAGSTVSAIREAEEGTLYQKVNRRLNGWNLFEIEIIIKLYVQRSVQHNLFIYVFKEATCFRFHKAILRPFIEFWPVVYYSARVNGIPYAFTIYWGVVK